MSMSREKQRLASLRVANDIRLARAKVKQELREGRISLRRAADLPCMASMTIFGLLVAQRNWGAQSANKACSRANVTPMRRVRDVTDRQMKELENARLAR